MRYSLERKEAVIKKMLPPENKTIAALAVEEGISEARLYNWRCDARNRGRLLPDGDTTPEGWSTRDKFAAVVETAPLNESERAEYCRQRGLYPEQIGAWRTACEQANDWAQVSTQQWQQSLQAERNRRRTAECELVRKEKALAETAALLTLRKRPGRSGGKTRTHDQCPGSHERVLADRRGDRSLRPSGLGLPGTGPDCPDVSSLET